MAHPLRYREDDPQLARLREIALALPGAQEKLSHGHPTFCTAKVFATFGGVVKGEHHSRDHEQSVLVKVDEAVREELLGRCDGYLPAYVGHAGWVGLDLHEGTDWDEVADLVEMSFRATAPRRLVAQLDPESP